MLAPPVQVALYVPFFVVGRPDLATVVPALFGGLVLLLVVVATWRITGMPWAGAIAGLLLLSSPEYWQRASLLPAYQPFVFFGYLGLVLTVLAVRASRRSTALAVAGGVALALSVYSFTIGLVFLPTALFLALLLKGGWRPVLMSLSTALLLLVPYAVWHIAAVGVREAWIYPHNFLLLEYSEHLRPFLTSPNQHDYNLPGYVIGALPDMLLGAAPMWLWLLVGAGLLIIGRVYGARMSVLITATIVTALVGFIVVQQPPHARYGYVLVPAAAVIAAVGLALALESLARHQAGRRVFVLSTVVLSVLLLLHASSAVSTHLDRVSAARAAPRYADLEAVASNVDDDRAVLARTSYLQSLLPENQVYTHFFFSEADYLDYVLWQDEDRVRQLFADRNIGWVVFQKNVRRWERDFNFWAFTASGQPPRHYICLPQSAGFTEVYDGQAFILYRVNQDWLQSESVSGSCTVPQSERWALPGAWRMESTPVSGEVYLEPP